jgi:L-iditol 2-dehydrogenase
LLQAVLYDQRDLRIIEVPIPEIGADEVLVRNVVSTTCGTDVKTYRRGYPLLKPPHPFGHEYSGVIERVGSDVRDFREGDRVAVHNTAPCGRCYWCKHGQPSMCEDMLFNRGSYAEYVRVPGRIVSQNMFLMPDTMDHKTASLMEPFSCAVYGIQNCPINQGDFIVVNGAGPIGLMFSRLAVLRGAQVLVTDIVEGRLAVARRLGVWGTLDLSGVEDAADAVRELTDGHRGADVVIEATGLIDVWKSSCRMARKGGFVLLFGGTKSGSVLEVDATLLHYSQLTIKGVFHTTPLCVSEAFKLLEMGVIDQNDFVQHEYELRDLESALLEHAAGKVIKNCIVYDS